MDGAAGMIVKNFNNFVKNPTASVEIAMRR
jgi:hypothetical protein